MWPFVGLLVFAVPNSGQEPRLDTVDVGELASRVHGTELVVLESLREQRSYRFEDFFWTGSGDGPEGDEEYLWSTDIPATIYQTKTVVSTVYVETTSPSPNSSTVETTTKCSFNCKTPSPLSGEITPTPTLNPEEVPTTSDELLDAGHEFWLVTVLKSGGKDPVITDLKNSLAKLYKTAFQRQQERHLGIGNRRKREIKEKKVKIYIHNVDRTEEGGEVQVVYHVAVAGQPVAAVTAAEDMTLVSDDEVRDELGYPTVIKAEPFLKPARPESLSRANNTWIFIGVSIVALLIILLLVAFITLGVAKRKRNATPGVDNRKQIFERGVGGEDNSAFVHHHGDSKNQSPTYINFRNQTVHSVIPTNRQSSCSSSSSSSASLDISPLMGLKKQRTPPRKPPRPKAAVTKTSVGRRIAPELFDSDSSNRGSPDTIYAGNYDPGVVSPKSFLSMPSVKAFPRGNMPEPLNKVLEPVSVLHLDMPDDDGDPEDSTRYRPGLTRHGSVGAAEDPGVIGPVVWNLHRQKLQHGVSVDEGIDDVRVPANASRMRKRFHDLLDDTFSLFGSRRGSPSPDSRPTPIEVKSHSAINRQNGEPRVQKPRPKTTDLRRVTQSPGSGSPKGAWSSAAPSPLIRPLSADPRPRINVDQVLATGKFKANDPAVPLIAAIKSEIEKCSLPGSTTELRQ